MNGETPLPFPESVKRYWWHLVPITLFPAFTVLLLSKKRDASAMWLLYGMFVAVSFYAMVPTIKRKAKHGFWRFACLLFLAGWLLAVLAAAAYQALTQPPGS
jgi:hypothetical protein